MKSITKTIFPLVIFLAFYSNAYTQELASAENKVSSVSVSLPKETSKAASFNFEVYNVVPEELNKVSVEMAGEHFMGELIAKKLYLLEDLYTYKIAIAPGNPAMRTMFRKPLIYNSVKKIEKAIKKSIRTGELSLAEATAKFDKVLEVAINLKSSNTNSFEEAIKATDNAIDLMDLYSSVKLSYLN